MKAFHTIAIPHADILAGRLTMDVFAADLWEVSQRRGPDEYKDAATFFGKTYMTQGLQNLLGVVEKRLRGEGGDPVIQIQTPFGGGKTHALIAMYHKAAEWDAKRIVVVGTSLSTEETPWALMEKQLTGKAAKLAGRVAPGKEKIRELLGQNQPVLILMDEVLEYVTKAAGVRVVDSTLAAQTMAFMQELSEVAGTLDRVSVVITLPSSITEHYDEAAEMLFRQLQKVVGRVEKIYTPVQEDEITKIIRRRLFSYVKENEAREIAGEFVSYAEREGILPVGMLPSEYRDRFIDSYPFMPEVVDVLYHRWGSFPTFQRTRGVLRLLALVVYALRRANKPYIGLADFDLADQQIRQELLRHIEPQFNSIIAADITDVGAGSKKVDESLGAAYRGLNLGRRAATTIFLYSFSGGSERGATVNEIKRSATTVENPSSVVAEAIEQLRHKLSYLWESGGKYFFSSQPNLNRILLTNIENVKESDVIATERELLQQSIEGKRLKVFLWEENAGNIPDSEDLKLVVLKKGDPAIMENILKNKGQTPRVYRNTLFFLHPLESERPAFTNAVKRKIAYEHIIGDKTLNLSDEQRNEIKRALQKTKTDLRESLRRLYRLVAVPTREGFKEIDLGIPTYGEKRPLDGEVYERLRSEGEILEKIAPLVIKDKYLTGNDYVSTEQIYQSSLRTPGEVRLANRAVLEQGIAEGVRSGLFGLGDLEGDKPTCRYFKEGTSVALSGSEVVISEATCEAQRKEEITLAIAPESPLTPTPPSGGTSVPGTTAEPLQPPIPTREMIQLRFQIPTGKVSRILGMMNQLQNKFQTLEIRITAKDGQMTEEEYDNTVKETFRQLGIEWEEG